MSPAWAMATQIAAPTMTELTTAGALPSPLLMSMRMVTAISAYLRCSLHCYTPYSYYFLVTLIDAANHPPQQALQCVVPIY